MSNNVIPLRRPTALPTDALADAYQYARMNEPCPNCDALPDAYCQRAGHTRLIPCVARLRNNNSNPTIDPPSLQAVDFSEPRRQEQ